MNDRLPPRAAALLLMVVVLAWGINWPVTKTVVQSVPPIWSIAVRSAIAAIVLGVLLQRSGNLIIPRRGDLPVVFSITLLHMVAFSALIAAGLQFVPASRAIVLGYTLCLWVAPGARIFLGEPITLRRAAGIALGLLGLVAIFNPASFDWSDRRALLGNGLILLAAMCWSASIVHIRGHTWVSTPFQLVFWEALLATGILAVLGLLVEGIPSFPWTWPLVGLHLYGGVVGTALGFWAMAMVNRSLPAITTSLGLLATPMVGIVSAALALGEAIDPMLFLAVALIACGIALGTVAAGRDPAVGTR